MVSAELLGKHSHHAAGVNVHVWRRSCGIYLARGYWEGRQFGQSLGLDPDQAESRLIEILGEITRGTFVPPSEARKRPRRSGSIPLLTLRELVERCLQEKRDLRGSDTAGDYEDRLTPAVQFAESPQMRRRYPHARDIDRTFALELRTWAFNLQVSRNGHPLSKQRRISTNHVRNILGTLSMVLNWAKRPEIGLLPLDFVNPFNFEIVGPRVRRDPLAPPKVPMELRIRMIQLMDPWQLCSFALAFTLPQRPEEHCGLLISDVFPELRELLFATRMGGDDFTKARQSFRAPYPPQLDPIVCRLINSRPEGPLLLRRTIFDRRRRPEVAVKNSPQVAQEFNGMLLRARPGEVRTEQDRKAVFRRLLSRMGGADPGKLAEEFKSLLADVDADAAASVRLYDLRGSISTEMKRAGVDIVFRRYVTGRSLNAEIMACYETQSLQDDMEVYFEHIQPLLDAIAGRAELLGIH